MPRFRKRPVEIEAMRWMGGDHSVLNKFCGANWARADAVGADYDDPEQVVVWDTTKDQWLYVPVGQWIVRGIKGELYPCEAGIFDATYDEVY